MSVELSQSGVPEDASGLNNSTNDGQTSLSSVEPQAEGYSFVAPRRHALSEYKHEMTADEYREVARVHHMEAKKLFERAQTAQSDDREHEAKLLTDLAIAQRERAEIYEKAANGDGHDPIVAEILDGLQEKRNGFTPTPGQLLGEQRDLGIKGRLSRVLASILRLQ